MKEKERRSLRRRAVENVDFKYDDGIFTSFTSGIWHFTDDGIYIEECLEQGESHG